MCALERRVAGRRRAGEEVLAVGADRERLYEAVGSWLWAAKGE